MNSPAHDGKGSIFLDSSNLFEMYQFPITIRFKILVIGAQVSVRDAEGREIFYVKRKALKLKEHIEVFRDELQTELLYDIHADRVLDFNSSFAIQDARSGVPIGSIGRKGMRSIWRAEYEIFDRNDAPTYRIREENPFVKLVAGVLENVPVVGLVLDIFSGYVLHPKYLVSRESDLTNILRITKRRSLTEGRFEITPIDDTGLRPFEPATLAEEQQDLLVLGILTMILIERTRG